MSADPALGRMQLAIARAQDDLRTIEVGLRSIHLWLDELQQKVETMIDEANRVKPTSPSRRSLSSVESPPG